MNVFALNRDLKLCDHVSDLIDCEGARLVKVKVAVDLSNKLWVVLCEFEDAGFHLFKEHFNACFSHWVVFNFGCLPCTLEHADKVLIIRYAHGDVAVIVEKLLESYSSITGCLGCLKVLQELIKDLILSLLALNEIGVGRDIVYLDNIFEVNHTRSITVKLGKDSLNHLCASRSHLIAKTSQELFIRYLAITIHIVVLDEGLQLHLLGEETATQLSEYSHQFK